MKVNCFQEQKATSAEPGAGPALLGLPPSLPGSLHVLCVPVPPTPHPPSRFGMTSLRAKTQTPLLMVIPVAFTRIDPATSGKSYLPVTKEPGGCSWVQ